MWKCGGVKEMWKRSESVEMWKRCALIHNSFKFTLSSQYLLSHSNWPSMFHQYDEIAEWQWGGGGGLKRSCSKTVQSEERLGEERQMMADDEISSTARAKKLSPSLLGKFWSAKCSGPAVGILMIRSVQQLTVRAALKISLLRPLDKFWWWDQPNFGVTDPSRTRLLLLHSYTNQAPPGQIFQGN